ncbi:hypothetical protein BCM20_000669 [Clostridium beijerinckii]|nr:hypothetical protein [Clostridium beijerinckii]
MSVALVFISHNVVVFLCLVPGSLPPLSLFPELSPAAPPSGNSFSNANGFSLLKLE